MCLVELCMVQSCCFLFVFQWQGRQRLGCLSQGVPFVDPFVRVLALDRDGSAPVRGDVAIEDGSEAPAPRAERGRPRVAVLLLSQQSW